MIMTVRRQLSIMVPLEQRIDTTTHDQVKGRVMNNHQLCTVEKYSLNSIH